MAEGTTPFADFGARPKTDDLQREEAYGSREAAGLAAAQPSGMPVLSPELKAKLESVCTATLSSQLRKRGLNNVSIDGLHLHPPGAGGSWAWPGPCATCPTARTCSRPTAAASTPRRRPSIPSTRARSWSWRPAAKRAPAPSGDILALRAQVRGAAAIITDGGVRDFSAVAAMDMPTYYANPHPAVLGRRHIPWDTDITIACGGTTVQPGDIIVADADGILVIPPALADELADDSIAQEREETFIAEMVQQGHSVDGLYPLNADWRARYQEWEAGKAND